MAGHPTTLRFATWNGLLGKSSRAGKYAFIERLFADGVDLVALQEVHSGAVQRLRQSSAFSVLASPIHDAEKMCVLLLGPRVADRDGSHALAPESVPSPKETVWANVVVDTTLRLSVASFHVVPGSMSKYGREPKRMNFRGIVEWLSQHPQRTIVGIDANSPFVDAFCEAHGPECLCQTRYFPGRLLAPNRGRDPDDPYAASTRKQWRFDQEEDLLHDAVGRAPEPTHLLRDAYRTYLGRDDSAAELALAHYQRTAAAQAGEGCLATTTINRGRERRFDFIYATPDLFPVTPVEHVVERGGTLSEGEHAAVIATFQAEPSNG